MSKVELLLPNPDLMRDADWAIHDELSARGLQGFEAERSDTTTVADPFKPFLHMVFFKTELLIGTDPEEQK